MNKFKMKASVECNGTTLKVQEFNSKNIILGVAYYEVNLDKETIEDLIVILDTFKNRMDMWVEPEEEVEETVEAPIDIEEPRL